MHGTVVVGIVDVVAVVVEDHVVYGSGCEEDATAMEENTGGDADEGDGEEDDGNCGRHRRPLCYCLRSYCCWRA